MSMLHQLAVSVGLSREWRDARNTYHVVADETIATILDRLGYPCGDDHAVATSLARRAAEFDEPPALLTADAGAVLALPSSLHGSARASIVGENGAGRMLAVEGGMLGPIDEPGYYRLTIAGRDLALAVAPRRAYGLDDIGVDKRWGAAVQIPSLREAAERPYGGLGELARAADRIAALGADALAISPLHALYPGMGSKFSPYSPSSRLFLNVSLADPTLVGLPPLPARSGDGGLIEWNTALPQRLADLRAIFAALDPARRDEVAIWATSGGEALARHALFDALLCHFAPRGAYGWRDWPAAFHDPGGAAARAFAADHPEEIAFHTFTQWLATRSLAATQDAARGAGMAIGLIADLAVGTDPSGSDAWSLGDAMFRGLSIGAPPDPLGPDGQNWGLTGFSPLGLRRNGFAPWIAMIRAALAHAGGLRIDHAFGLSRLWIIPAERPASGGAYLAFPFDDLLRLIALESWRARAIVLAEDLGTVPDGFSDAIAARGLLGMRVLWFERDDAGGFRPPASYTPQSAAMTGTHDLPTVAGWWRGGDVAWADALGRLPPDGGRDAAEWRRGSERAALWRVIGNGTPQPAPDDPAPVVEAALAHIGGSAARMAIVPLEDLLALDEQPNIPGTIDEHPNWRRRLTAPLGPLLDQPGTRARIDALDAARRG